MEERSMTMREAMDIVYKSKTYAALNNTKTGLYFQSPAYLYDSLEKELKMLYRFCSPFAHLLFPFCLGIWYLYGSDSVSIVIC